MKSLVNLDPKHIEYVKETTSTGIENYWTTYHGLVISLCSSLTNQCYLYSYINLNKTRAVAVFKLKKIKKERE